ncbi:peroxisomal acyl-coenzyme A oxidase 3 [Hyposmocoma kahamanoa]|uniref:peroxisomal acyl-coenzyme A oxidase 3 n=1 Tax=Hyposmocoma kahamanoa TaxID=1477025 RepID=UPI000E6D736C|nr:peroxisomal acyl-coenzyme A oxidase 3 [Hyposmocoma kahamanoa]
MEDLSFLPDLPSGPLDVYRSSASFDWKRLKLALEGDIDFLKLKYKVWRTLEKDPLFAHNLVTPVVEEQKRITQLQLKRVNSYKFLTDEMFKSTYSKRTRALMTINEAVQSLNPSVSVKMAIGIYLFSNALLSLGTERHLKFYEATISKREILASFALTEIAHGSDARLMRTTATYDPKHREFVIHTPDFEAAKCWVGNLGRTCTHTLLFAQLITPDGSNHGLHGFVVPIRDPDTLETYPGLIVGDMGEKVGVNGIDNGRKVPLKHYLAAWFLIVYLAEFEFVLLKRFLAVYFWGANLGDIRNNHDPTVTYEGDNNVLQQQAGNWLLRQYETVLNGGTVDSPLGTVAFLNDYKLISVETFACTETSQLKTPQFITSTYKWLLCWLLKETREKYNAEIGKGLSAFQAKTKSQVYRWKTLTRVYAEYLAIMFSLESIEKKEKSLQPVLYKLFTLYGLWSLDNWLVELYQGGFSKGEALARLVREAVLELCGDLKGEVVSVADALAPTDFVLNSVLGKSDGKLYQNLQKAFFSQPGVFERAPWWRDVTGPKSKL